MDKLNLNLTYKLIFSFLFFVSISIIVQIFSSYFFSNKIFYEKTKETITVENNFKKKQIETYFTEKLNNLNFLSQSSNVKELVRDLNNIGDSLNIKVDEPFNIRHPKYVSVYNNHINYFTKFINTYEFDDLYIIDAVHGHISFSVQKLKDLGSNLGHGRYKDNHLAKMWQTVSKTGKPHIQDFEIYEPLKNQNALFIGIPILERTKVIAVIAVRIGEKQINKFLNVDGLSTKAESYLVGFNSNRETELRSKRNKSGEAIGTPIQNKLIDAALRKEETGFAEYNLDGIPTLIGYTQIRAFNIHWGVFTTIPKSDVYSSIMDMTLNNIFAGLVVILLILILGSKIAGDISKPIIEIKNNLLLLSKGVLPKRDLEIHTQNEIGQIQLAFNKVVEGMKKYVDFANKIGNKKLGAKFEKLSNDDILGNSLLIMQSNLKKAEEDAEKRQQEEKKQRWTTEGIAKFGDILRQNYTDMREHSNNIIQNLVGFLEINQGGIFLYNNDELNPKLELTACFAYDRKKFMQKEIDINEGLIGSCYLEKETIYLTNIPEDYANISSGLGSATPKAVLIVPLKMDMKILGVIELISFNYFENHEISFVEKIAENIASSIYSSQINVQTQKLLEESRLQSEQMAAQEEEMRQNMEELQATQEESERREAETNSVITALNSSVFVCYLSLDGTIIECNQNLIDNLAILYDDFVGKEYRKFNSIFQEEDIINRLLNERQPINITSKIITLSKEIVLNETYTLIKNNYDEPIKIIIISHSL